MDWNTQLDLPGKEKKYGLPPGLLHAVLTAESAGNPQARSPRGAQGLFQFMPETAQGYGIDPNDPAQAAEGAARMYSDLNKQYAGDVPKMLAGYNWGSGNLAKHGFDNMPPETRGYIDKVQALMPSPGSDSLMGGAATDELDPFADVPMAGAPKDEFSGVADADPFADVPMASQGAALQKQIASAQAARDAADKPPTPLSWGDRGILAGETVAKAGIGAALGLPDLAASAAILPYNLISDDRKWSQDLFPLTHAAYDVAGATRDALGIKNVEPQTFGEKAAANIGEFAGATVGGSGIARGVASAAPALAPVFENIAPKVARVLAEPRDAAPWAFNSLGVQDVANSRAEALRAAGNNKSAFIEQAKPTAAEITMGAGAGAGATVAQEYSPDAVKPYAVPLAALFGGGGAKTAANLASGAGSTVRNLKDSFIDEPAFGKKAGDFSGNFSKRQVDRAGHLFQAATSDKEAALKALEDAGGTFAGDAVQNTAGKLSNDPGLLAVEGGLRTAPAHEKSFAERDKALQEQNAATMQTLAPAETGNAQKTVDEIAGQVQKTRDVENQKVAQEEKLLTVGQQEAADSVVSAESKALQAKAEQDKIAKELATPTEGRVAASESLVNDVLLPAKKAAQDEYKAKIAPFEADTSARVDTAPVQETISGLEGWRKKFGQNSGHKALIDDVFDTLGAESKSTDTGVLDAAGNPITKTTPKEPLSVARLTEMEQELNAATRKARADRDGNSAAGLDIARKAVTKLLDDANPGDSAYADARKFYRENVAEPFQHGTMREVLKPGAHGEQLANPAAEAIGRIFTTKAGSSQAVDQLLTTAPRAKIVPKVRSAAIDEMQRVAINPTTGEFDHAAARKFVVDHKDAFDKVPEVQKELFAMINRAEKGESIYKQAANTADEVGKKASTSVTMMRDRLKEVQDARDAAIKADEQSAAKHFLGEPSPEVAIKKTISSSRNLTKDLKELMDRTAKDKTGKATLGLKEMVYNHMEDKLLAADTSDKLSAFIKKYQKDLLDSGIHTPEDEKALDTLRKRMEVDERASPGVAQNFDPGAARTAKVTKAVLRSGLRAISGGFKGGTQYSMIRDAYALHGGGSNVMNASEKIFARALLDPELAKLLLKRDLSRFEESTFRAKISNVLIRNAGGMSVEDNKPETKPKDKIQ